mgnify:FL=1
MKMITQFKNSIFIFLFIAMPLTAQENDKSKSYVQEGDQIKYTEFHTNGQIAQTGYFLNGKNHGLWTSFNLDGTKKSEGTFNNGQKVDAWFFWNDKVLIEVTYKNNAVEKAIQWDQSEVLASKDLE